MDALPRVLIVDASRVIRASLSKILTEFFDVREEANGESAWQTLVLDSSIVAVISGASLPKLDGYGLVERMRSSKLQRLRETPFFLIISDTVGEGERQQARIRGVTDFLQKGMASAQIGMLVAAIRKGAEVPPPEDPATEGRGSYKVGESVADEESVGTASNLGISDIMGQMGRMAGMSGITASDVMGSAKPVPEFPPRAEVELFLTRYLAAGGNHSVGVLVFGLDSYPRVAQRFGSDLADKIALKFGRLLANKIRTDDCIGAFLPGRVAIVAPGTNRALCASFAERVCKGLAAAQISIRGERVDMTVSVGVAAVPEDGVALSADDFLMLANGRMDAALKAGGNRVESGQSRTSEDFRKDEFVLRLKEIMTSVSPEALQPCLGSVGLQIVPVLKQIDLAFNLGLPLDDIERKLWSRARSERMMG
ncbi:MAG TPA: diguanylate cyclase [Rhodocyclaceae bacterium]|jgi:diguanylate cyclase (GGDEF)-like protein|nr:diguanylate cyclase [Rhodocyclaceae bacterium]HMV19831.1 diguanylate cyclase [Rhodocyclaceae bacterium]HMY50632.1 diguanylate cyclase [Rhodocyclaceae bacterium]HNE43537.1 diguanylate cyclase [Rhodocyclaceae bacterium]HNL20975.1 diguanylate cyclase [Rhodocyclaceae bacterium]